MTIRPAGTPATDLQPGVCDGRAFGTRPRFVRVAAHAAAWSPFPVSVAGSFGRSWHAVGDGALIALQSWLTFSRHISLVGQPTVLPGGPHDLGPAEFWLLAIPVRLDPGRGVIWGAALLCLVAASVAIEAAWAVHGETGALLASGLILAIVAWMPEIPVRPYWNPFFGVMWFLAALAAAWAVMSGYRKWWPVLVFCASLAAQAHLMFALASAGLVLVALMVALASDVNASAGRRWLIIGLIVGAACWLPPLGQQFISPHGNMSALIRAASSGRASGLGFAMRALTAFTEPPALWWQRHLGVRTDLYGVIQARPTGFAVAVLGVTALVVPLAVVRLGSRWLASLATVSLIADAAAAITFSGISPDDGSRLSYLILVMFPAGLLAWLTIGSAVLLSSRQWIISRRAGTSRQSAATATQPGTSRSAAQGRLASYGGRAAATALIVLASLHDLGQASSYPGPDATSGQVAAADRLIERAKPPPGRFALFMLADSRGEKYQVGTGLLYALTVQGYDPYISVLRPIPPVPQVVVLIKGSKIAVDAGPVPAGGGRA